MANRTTLSAWLRVAVAGFALAALAGPVSCADGAGLGEDGDSSTGTLVVSISTEGDDPDRDGYLLRVDKVKYVTLDPTGTAEISLAAGPHGLSLLGVAGQCLVAPGAALAVSIAPRGTTPVAFKVSCSTTMVSRVLAFESGGDIYVSDTNGSGLQRLTSDGSPFSYNREAAWSPDGRRIAFSRSDGNWGAEIYLIDPDGVNPKRLSPAGAYDATPTWSPDGSRIAFENRADNTSGGHIFVMNVDGTNRVQLTTNRQPNSEPAWSPDGRRIAYVTYPDSAGDEGTDIYVIDADGTNRRRLTNGKPFDDNRPAWSPNGSRIVFSRSGDLIVMNADGTNPSHISVGGSPAWSPDGAVIATSRATDCQRDPYGDVSCRASIWVVSVADGSMHELPLQVRGPRGASWRP